MPQTVTLRVMTYNVGGGRKRSGSNPGLAAEVVRQQQPDILAVQEAMDLRDSVGAWYGSVRELAQAGAFGENYYFGPTLTLTGNFDARKRVMVEALYAGYQEWRQGNAVYSRTGFCSLGDPPNVAGLPRSVPLYRPPVYHGTRDTDPRYAILARAAIAPAFPYVVNTHLTTLNGERSSAHSKSIPGKAEEAVLLRYAQVQRLLDLLAVDCTGVDDSQGGVGELPAGESCMPLRSPTILLGDMNAVASEVSIASLLVAQAGFERLVPENEKEGTHPKAEQPIDHIFIYPSHRLEKYRCWVVPDPEMEASDHNAVVADIVLRCDD